MEINLSRGYVAKVSQKDYKRVQAAGPWFAHVDEKRNVVYAERNIRKADGKWTMQKLHRFILRLTEPRVLGDHKDGDGLNNLRSNLRKATRSQSECNKGKRKDNTSGYTGVSWDAKSGMYYAYINVNHKRKVVGRFSGKVAAHKAVEAVRVIKHGSFVRQA